YNLYRQGATFQRMAKGLGISRPTVYDFLRAVCKDIGQETVGGKPTFNPSWDWDDWEKKHKPRCPSCKTGDRLCRAWERKIGLPSSNPFLPYTVNFDVSKLASIDALDLWTLLLKGHTRPPKIGH